MGATQVQVAVAEPDNLVRVLDRFWVAAAVQRSTHAANLVDGGPSHHRVDMVPIADKGPPAPLAMFWEAELGTEIRHQAELPDPAGGLDDAETIGALLDADRLGAIASAGLSAFQLPFRDGRGLGSLSRPRSTTG